jgi:hypothetical protein
VVLKCPAIAMFTLMMGAFGQTMWFNPENQVYIIDTYHKNIFPRLTAVLLSDHLIRDSDLNTSFLLWACTVSF